MLPCTAMISCLAEAKLEMSINRIAFESWFDWQRLAHNVEPTTSSHAKRCCEKKSEKDKQ